MEKKKFTKKILMTSITIIAFLILITGNSNLYALEDVENYSELYKQYLALSDEEKSKVEVIPEKYNVSLKEYNESNNNSMTRSLGTANALPERYNLAEHYEIKVENQGQEGNCWTFASLETLETYLQVHGFGTFDFSENHLNYIESNLFSETQTWRKINTGSDYTEFQEYVNKKLGPVLEEDYPYYEDENMLIHKEYTQDELDSLLNVTPLAYVGEYVSFPSVDKENMQYSDIELTEYRKTVKEHIMENGALFAIITAPSYYSNEFYNSDTYAAYFPTTMDSRFIQHSHAIAIIGWDDNFSKENFIEENKPEHDGAYIALNSWGKDFGDNGIYYISYDDAFVEQGLRGIKEAVTDISELKNTTSFTIKDKNLYDALKKTFERKIISYDDSIKQITMLNGSINEITHLDLVDFNITDLSGIENLTNLYSLNLSHNNISNIEPLLLLHNLEDIDLRYNQLTEIPAELKNAQLNTLSLSYNPITDFSGIADIKRIVNLNLEGTQIKEADLILLKNLRIINLNLSKTDIKDYSILKTLNDGIEEDPEIDLNLQQLNISYNEDIIYSSIPSVNNLNISNTDVDENKFNQITDTSRISSLDISYTNIKDLSVLSGCTLRSIDISGNRNLENFDILKTIAYIDYQDAGLSDVSVFVGGYNTQLNLSQNEIEDYVGLLQNEYLTFVDLSDNKISQIYYSDKLRVVADGNNIKPVNNNVDNIESIKNQTYVETLKVDINRDNVFTEIGLNLKELHSSGAKLKITNATVDYDNNEFRIDDYNKDVVIKVESGIYEGSTITYKIEKVEDTTAYYIYIDKTNLKTIYAEGENFDVDGLKVYVVYDNNSMCEIKDYVVTGANNLQVGNNLIKVEKDGLEEYIEVNAISNDDILTLSFETLEIYEATLKKIGDIEKERRNYPDYYTRVQVLISKDDDNKTIKILKEDLNWITYLEIKSDEAISLEDIKQLKALSGISIDGKNIEDLSVLKYFKEILDNKEDLLPYERFLALVIKNNEKITGLEDDIYTTIVIDNSKIKDINNLTNLTYLKYKGSELPEMENILDKIRMIFVEVTSNIDDVERDESSNIILPNLLKTFKDRGFEIEANINDQIRDEQYLNPYNKTNIAITERNGNLILNYEDIKDVVYEGSNQYIEISVQDVNNNYTSLDFKYNIKYKLFNHIELDNTEEIEIEEDTVPDLSNLTVYKVYSNNEKVETKDFTYSKDKVTKDLEEIEISYSEDSITSKIRVPVIVTDHVHEWGEWVTTKEATETEEGQKERICLKNENHKEITKIDKLLEEDYRIIEGADQTIKTDTNKDLVIKINADHEKFDKLSVDKKIVDPENYTITKGSTIITLSTDYLNTLSVGKHTIEAFYKDGKSVTTSLTIANTSDTNPKTGDNIENYIITFSIAIVGCAMITIVKKIHF